MVMIPTTMVTMMPLLVAVVIIFINMLKETPTLRSSFLLFWARRRERSGCQPPQLRGKRVKRLISSRRPGSFRSQRSSSTTMSSTSYLMSSMSCKSKKPRKVRQKKKKKIGGGSCPPGKCLVFGGGKCPNLGVVNVRILGVVNVLLANDSQSYSAHTTWHVLSRCNQYLFDCCAQWMKVSTLHW